MSLALKKSSEEFGERALATDSLCAAIKDTDWGIPAEQQEQIFTKLFRADTVKERDTKGTSLGLYLVKSIVEHSGGNVWFNSQEGKGSTFFVTFPTIHITL